MRGLLTLLMMLPALLFAQSTDLLITVTPNFRTGTDRVELAAVKAGYPQDLMQQQANALCRNLGSSARGFIGQNYKIGDQTFTKCSFGTDGLVNRTTGQIRLTPLVQAFAGAPSPYTVEQMIIIVQGMQPTGNTLREFGSKAVRVQTNSTPSPPQIEYRVALLSQDPADLVIPDERTPEQKTPANTSTQRQKGLDWTMWVAIFTAALAAAFIVYFLLLRTSTRSRG